MFRRSASIAWGIAFVTGPVQRSLRAFDRHPMDPLLVLGRMFDQGALGVVTLLLARWLPVSEFAAASVLLIVNSVAVTLADLGLGYAVLALSRSDRIEIRILQRLRVLNVTLAICGTVLGLSIGGTVGGVLAGSTLLWAAAGESYVRGAGALRLGNVRGVVRGQALGAISLLGAVMFVEPGRGVAVLSIGLLAKHLVEGLLATGWTTAFDQGGVRARTFSIFLSQGSAVVLANIDFAVAAALLGSMRYATYLLAFRFAQIPVTLIANVVSRTTLLRLADLPVGQRQDLIDRNFRNLFGLGLAGAVTLTLAGPLMSGVIGSAYDSLPAVLALVAVAVPWRMVAGQAGALFVIEGRAGALAGAFFPRLILSVTAMAAGVWLDGLRGFVLAGTLSVVLITAALLVWSARVAGLQASRNLPGLVIASLGILVPLVIWGGW